MGRHRHHDAFRLVRPGQPFDGYPVRFVRVVRYEWSPGLPAAYRNRKPVLRPVRWCGRCYLERWRWCWRAYRGTGTGR